MFTSETVGSFVAWAEFSVGFSSQDEAIDVARPAAQGTHYHESGFLIPPRESKRIVNDLTALRVRPTLPTIFKTPTDNTLK